MPGCGLCPVLVGSVRVIRGGVHVECVVIKPHADVCFERSREVIVSGGGEWRERECGVMRGLRYVCIKEMTQGLWPDACSIPRSMCR
jgi:hypothetical protein